MPLDSTNEAQKKLFRKVNEKFLRGDAISDTELNILLDVYGRMESDLNLFAPDGTYHLAWKEINYRLSQLKGFQQARQEKSR